MTATPAPPPPALPTDDPTAVEGRRIAAWTIDLVAFLVALAAAIAATGGVSWTTHEFPTPTEAADFCVRYEGSTDKVCSHVGNQAALVRVGGSANWPIVWFVCTIAYIVLQGVTGASPGKLLVGLRVVTVDGRLAGVGKSFLRTCLWLVDAITCGLPAVGGTLMVTKPGHQRYGDRVAGTFVVAKEHVGRPVVIPAPQAAPYAFPLPPPGYAPPQPPPAWPAPTAHTTPSPTTDGPHWDDDRDTYIQYDRAVEMWVQWDEASEHWRPIDT